MPGPGRGPSAYFPAVCPRAGPQTPPASLPPAHFLARLPPAALGVPPRPLPAPSRWLPLRDCGHQKEGVRPQQREQDSRQPLGVRLAGVSSWVGDRLSRPSLGGVPRAGVTDGTAEPRRPPPPTQLTCHPRPRYFGQRDSGRKSHSGSPLIGPVRAAVPSLRGGSTGLDWTPALSVRPLGRALPRAPGRAKGSLGSLAAWRRVTPTWSAGDG